MRIIYVSTLCSHRKFHELFKLCKEKPVQQGQKYTSLLVSGIAANDIDVSVLSVYPINRNNSKRLYFKREVEFSDNIRYTYMSFINMKIIKNIAVFLNTIIELLKVLRKNEDAVIIVDGLNTTISFAATISAKLKKVKIISTITDIPFYMHGMEFKQNKLIFLRNNIICRIFNYVTNNSAGFIFLTEYMNEIKKNPSQRSVIIEGVVDSKMVQVANDFSKKYEKKVCIYSGALNEIYGVKNLAKAFVIANVRNSEMRFYGSGDCSTYLSELAKENSSIKFLGVIENNQVVQEQMKATLLFNPRPSNEVYTKYSFPSKNMEYMASGTPLLTTKLPGMPQEYLQYIYLINNETVDGLAEDIQVILSKDPKELHEKGQEAKEFVLKEKNPIVQGMKLINMLKQEN